MPKDLNRDRAGVPWLSQVRTRHWPLIVLPCQSFLKWALGNWLFPFIVIYRPSRASNKGGWGDWRARAHHAGRVAFFSSSLNPRDWGRGEGGRRGGCIGVCACVHDK